MNLLKTYLALCCLAIMIFAGCKKDDVKKPPTAPVVTTAALTNITSTGATGGGSIVSDGGDTVTASGIVWSETNAMPTLADSVVAGTAADGTFTADISGLEFDRSYYIRAFATNSVGTGYGEVVTLNTANDSNKVRFTYNGEEVVYGVIVSPTTGKRWLDRNLGAQQVATALDDYLAYGDLFQWGRPADGHQLTNWTSATTGASVNATTTELATSDTPGHGNFIIPPNVDPWTLDWRDDNNSNRWMTNRQGPCPAGWHVPTSDEWSAEVFHNSNGGTATSGGITNSGSSYSLLKLTVAGLKQSNGFFVGQIKVSGAYGNYWSSTDQSSDGVSIANFFESSSDGISVGIATTQRKSLGFSIRCIKD
jgi:uncharacterized protein (TIGR02145 family)